jgi:hypothetical protein
MRRAVRWPAWSLAGLAFFVMLVLGGCILFTRHALHDSALASPAWSCIRAKDDLQDQRLIDRSLTMQIQQRERDRYRQEHGPSYGMGRWHLSGMAALIGLKLGYSVNERRAMALPTLSHTPVCQRPATH